MQRGREEENGWMEVDNECMYVATLPASQQAKSSQGK